MTVCTEGIFGACPIEKGASLIFAFILHGFSITEMPGTHKLTVNETVALFSSISGFFSFSSMIQLQQLAIPR
jgi:hypothetical protein